MLQESDKRTLDVSFSAIEDGDEVRTVELRLPNIYERLDPALVREVVYVAEVVIHSAANGFRRVLISLECEVYVPLAQVLPRNVAVQPLPFVVLFGASIINALGE